MKNLLLVAALFLSVTSFAQSAQEEVDLLQSMYGMQKKDIVADFIKLEGAQKDAFWKLYDAYELERQALGVRRINLLGAYAENYGTLDDTKIDAMVKEMNDLGLKNDKLISTYYKKMTKPVGYKAAAKFTQIEYYLLSTIRAEILEEIPFIGELD